MRHHPIHITKDGSCVLFSVFDTSGHGADVPPVYALDSTDKALYDEKVLQPAIAIVEAFQKVIGILYHAFLFFRCMLHVRPN